MLIKGPLILMVVGLTATHVVDRRSLGALDLALRPFAGFVWLLLLVLPWFVAIVAKSGDSFFEQSVGQDMLAKVFERAGSAWRAAGTITLLLFWVTFWPGSVLAGLAAPADVAARREPGARFLLAWLVPSWIVFEVVMTKLPHYVLPLYPAIAILIAGVLESRRSSPNRWLVRGTVGWFVVSRR